MNVETECETGIRVPEFMNVETECENGMQVPVFMNAEHCSECRDWHAYSSDHECRNWHASSSVQNAETGMHVSNAFTTVCE